MTKKRSPEFEAIRLAMRRPERRAFCSRRMAWARGDWPVKWNAFTNWRGFSISVGVIEKVSDGDTAPKAVLLVSLDWRPFAFVIFWHGKRLVWIGDWEWKKSLYGD